MTPWGWIIQNMGLRFGGPGNAVGENQASPTSTTILGRLKAIADALARQTVAGVSALPVAQPEDYASRSIDKRISGLKNTTATQNQIIQIAVGTAPPANNYTVTSGKRLVIPQFTVSCENLGASGAQSGLIEMLIGTGATWHGLAQLVAVPGAIDRAMLTFPRCLIIEADTLIQFRVAPSSANSTNWRIYAPAAHEV